MVCRSQAALLEERCHEVVHTIRSLESGDQPAASGVCYNRTNILSCTLPLPFSVLCARNHIQIQSYALRFLVQTLVQTAEKSFVIADALARTLDLLVSSMPAQPVTATAAQTGSLQHSIP